MHNIINDKNPKFQLVGEKRYDGFNMVQLPDPGLPFIKNIKGDIRTIGKHVQDLERSSNIW